jgi:hypothetical protein
MTPFFPRCDQRGFALPLVILLVALLTVLLTTGLTRARTERQIAHASDETALARTIAQGALQIFLAGMNVRPLDRDSERINYIGGYANVIAHLVRRPADTTERSLYVLRSTGVVINPDSGPRGWATHTVAQFAEWETGHMHRAGALTAIGSIFAGNPFGSVRISGIDSCSVEAPIPGARTTGTIGPRRNDLTLEGNPPLMDSENWSTILDSTDVDWASALGGGLTPDYTTFQNGDTTYSIQRISGNLSISSPSSGTGVLVVGGTLTVSSPFTFSGIVLVNGAILFSATSVRIEGLVIAGLGGGGGPKVAVGGTSGQQITITFSSCAVSRALIPLTGLAPVRNAWMDVWAY